MQTSPSPADEVVDLREYAAILRRRIWLILAAIVFFTGLAGAYSFTWTPTYTGHAEVLVEPPSLSSGLRPDQIVSIDTEARLVKSAPIAVFAKRALHSTLSITDILKQVSVETTTDTLVLDISFSDQNPQRAADGANAFANGYLQYRQQRALASVLADREQIQNQIDKLTEKRRELDRTLGETVPGSLEYKDAQQERDTVNNQIAVLTSQMASIPASTDPGQVILPATVPLSPSSPKHSLDLAMGFALGLFIGVVGAFIRDRTDERIAGRGDLELTIDAPVLASIPRVVGWNKRGPVWLVTEQQPRSPAAEAYRTLRTGVMALSRQRELKVFAITSPLLGEGKSTTSANLATALAQADRRVLAVSADLRRPSLHSFFHTQNELGLSDVLLGEIQVEEAMKHLSPNLWVLTSGQVSARPAELLQSHKMVELIEQQADQFDFLIIDCPPVIGLSDTLAIAPFVDAVLMVVQAEKSKRDAILHSMDQLNQVGAGVRGAVLNNFSVSKRRAETYGGYGYGYGAEEAEEEAFARRPSARRRPEKSNGNAQAAGEQTREQPLPPEPPEVPVVQRSQPESVRSDQ